MKGVAGVRGPGMEGMAGVEMDCPSCVRFESEKDAAEFQQFCLDLANRALKMANENALNLLADFVKAQNLAMQELVTKLGGNG